MRNFNTSGNTNIGYNHFALEIIVGRIKIIFFLTAETIFARSLFCPQFFARSRMTCSYRNGLGGRRSEIMFWVNVVHGQCTSTLIFLTALPDQLPVLEHTTAVY